jgi:hypothetical protein
MPNKTKSEISFFMGSPLCCSQQMKFLKSSSALLLRISSGGFCLGPCVSLQLLSQSIKGFLRVVFLYRGIKANDLKYEYQVISQITERELGTWNLENLKKSKKIS